MATQPHGHGPPPAGPTLCQPQSSHLRTPRRPWPATQRLPAAAAGAAAAARHMPRHRHRSLRLAPARQATASTPSQPRRHSQGPLPPPPPSGTAWSFSCTSWPAGGRGQPGRRPPQAAEAAAPIAVLSPPVGPGPRPSTFSTWPRLPATSCTSGGPSYPTPRRTRPAPRRCRCHGITTHTTAPAPAAPAPACRCTRRHHRGMVGPRTTTTRQGLAASGEGAALEATGPPPFQPPTATAARRRCGPASPGCRGSPCGRRTPAPPWAP